MTTRFNNPTEIDIQFSGFEGQLEEVESTEGVELTFEKPKEEETEPTEKTPNPVVLPEDSEEETGDEDEDKVEISFEKTEEIEEEEEVSENPYLAAVNRLHDLGFIEEPYEGFTDDTEPSIEVLEKLIEHNITIKERKALEEFVEEMSPLTQRILNYDLNAKGENIESFLKSLIQENSIKSLSIENEYDQEKIVRMWYNDEDYTPEEIDEKIEELKTSSLLEKEAKRVKPKLDVRAEAIAKEQEESEAMLRKIENDAKEHFYNRVEQIVKTGKVNNLAIPKEVAQKVMAMLLYDDVPVTLPQGKKVKMNYLDAQILQHKYSKQGNPELLVQVAYLLADPEGFYKQFANSAKTAEVNKFTKEHKYNLQTKSQGSDAPDSKVKKSKTTQNVPWNFKTN